MTLHIYRNRINVESKKRGRMNISKFKKEITLCIIALAVVVEVVSLPFLGWNILFAYGLAIGTVVAIVNTNILSRAAQKAVDTDNKKVFISSYILRIVIYGGAFILSIKTAGIAGLGTAIGFFLPQISMYIVAGLLPKIRKMRGLENPVHYETDETKRVFEKNPWIELCYNERIYKSYKRFRIVKLVQGEKREP